jgi:hypothetical protein
MNVVPFKAEHLMDLQLQLAQQGIAPFISADYAKAIEGPYAFTGMVDGRVIAVGWVAEIWSGRAMACSLIDQRAGVHFVAIHKAARRVLDSVPWRRVEADTPCGFEQGHRWLRMLGFECEAERMRTYLPDGTDSALYARVR